MDKYAFYYEVEYCLDDGGTNKEGGFLLAHDHADAMNQLIALYDPDLKGVHIEYMDTEAFIFPIEKAREAKDWVNANASY